MFCVEPRFKSPIKTQRAAVTSPEPALVSCASSGSSLHALPGDKAEQTRSCSIPSVPFPLQRGSSEASVVGFGAPMVPSSWSHSAQVQSTALPVAGVNRGRFKVPPSPNHSVTLLLLSPSSAFAVSPHSPQGRRGDGCSCVCVPLWVCAPRSCRTAAIARIY